MLSVFVVEIFDTVQGGTLGFYPITASSVEHIDGLATELCIAMNHGRSVGGTDWRQISEHPYSPGATDTAPLKLVNEG